MLPFEVQNIELDIEDLRALDRYYCQPYYNRDPSEIAHIGERNLDRESENDCSEQEHVIH